MPNLQNGNPGSLSFRDIALHLSAIGGPASRQADTDTILFIVHYPITSK